MALHVVMRQTNIVFATPGGLVTLGCNVGVQKEHADQLVKLDQRYAALCELFMASASLIE